MKTSDAFGLMDSGTFSSPSSGGCMPLGGCGGACGCSGGCGGECGCQGGGGGEPHNPNQPDLDHPNTPVSGSWTNLTGTSFYQFKAENLRQLVRLKIKVKGGTTPPTGQEGVVYRILPPTWYDKAV